MLVQMLLEPSFYDGIFSLLISGHCFKNVQTTFKSVVFFLFLFFLRIDLQETFICILKLSAEAVFPRQKTIWPTLLVRTDRQAGTQTK